MDIKALGKGVCFGGAATLDNTLEVAPDWKLQSSRGIFTCTSDAAAASANAVALITGNPAGVHLEYDNNEIMAKSNGTTASTLYLNNDDGLVQIGNGGLSVSGTISEGGTSLASKYVDKSGDTMTGALTLPRVIPRTSVGIDDTPVNQPEGLTFTNVSSYSPAPYATCFTMKDNNARVAQLLLGSHGNDAAWRGGRETEGWSAWRTLWHTGNLKIATGTISLTISSGGTTVSESISYSAAGFTSSPVISLCPITTAPALFDVSTATPGTTSCTVYLYRSSGTGTTTLKWVAIGT